MIKYKGYAKVVPILRINKPLLTKTTDSKLHPQSWKIFSCATPRLQTQQSVQCMMTRKQLKSLSPTSACHQGRRGWRALRSRMYLMRSMAGLMGSLQDTKSLEGVSFIFRRSQKLPPGKF